MKTCPKCNNEHNKPGTFCSRGCANSHKRSDFSKEKTSQAMKNKHFRTPEIIAQWKLSFVANKEARRKVFLQEEELLLFDELTGAGKRRRILSEQNNNCAHCRIEQQWNGKFLIFELEHKDGNNKNNSRGNLELICPNCHSQTPTWKRAKKSRKNMEG